MDTELDASVKATTKKERRHPVRRTTKPKSRDLRNLLNKRYQRNVTLGTSLTVDNIKYTVTNNDLNLLFKNYGPLMKAKVIKNEKGESLGIAEVVFRNDRDAVAALKDLNGRTFDGRELRITIGHRIQERSRRSVIKRKSRKPSHETEESLDKQLENF